MRKQQKYLLRLDKRSSLCYHTHNSFWGIQAAEESTLSPEVRDGHDLLPHTDAHDALFAFPSRPWVNAILICAFSALSRWEGLFF